MCSSNRGEQPNQNKTKQDRFVAVQNFQEQFKVRLVIRVGGGGKKMRRYEVRRWLASSCD